MPANLENSAVATGLAKVSFSFQSQNRAVPKNVQITVQLPSFHMLVRLCSKTFKLGFNSTWTKNFQMYKLGLEKAEESEIKLPIFAGSLKNQGSPRKTSTLTERLHFHFSLSCIEEGNGNPLQCSCLENPRDRGAWWVDVYGITQSWTQLKRLSSSSCFIDSKAFDCVYYNKLRKILKKTGVPDPLNGLLRS